MNSKSKNLLLYILKPDGQIEELDLDDLPSKLISVNVIYLYHNEKRRLYIWIGKNAGQKLKNSIPIAEKIILEKNPDISIIRHFTVDEGNESSDFWADTLLDQDLIRKKQRRWAEFRLEKYAFLSDLKINITSAKNVGNFETALNYIEQLIQTAREIYDWDIIEEYTKLKEQILRVKDLKSRKSEIKGQIPHMIAKLDSLIKDKKFIDAHNTSEVIREYYSILFNESIPSKFQRSLNSEKILYDNYLRQKKDFQELLEQFEALFPERNLKDLHRIGQKILRIHEEIPELEINSLIKEKIDKIEDDYKLWEKEEQKFNQKLKMFKERYEDAKYKHEYEHAFQTLNQIIDFLNSSNHSSELIRWKQEKETLQELKDAWTKQEKETQSKRNKNIEYIQNAKEEIEQFLSNHQFPETFSHVEKLYLFALQTKDEELQKDVSDYRDQINERVTNLKLLEDLVKKINSWEEILPELENQKQYNKILSDLAIFLSNEILSNSPENKEHLEKIKRSIEKKKAAYEENLSLYNRLRSEIKENKNNLQWQALKRNTERIIEILPLIEKDGEIYKYNDLQKLALTKIEEILSQHNKEQTKLLEKAKEVEEIIKVEKNVLPLVEDLSLEDILPNLSDDINEAFAQIGALLDEQRVDVKKEMESSLLLTSKSGETMEIKSKSQISMYSPDLNKNSEETSKISPFRVNSGFENPFNDAIAEAIIEDIIPYNFEISDITIDGIEKKIQPSEELQKEGLVLHWKLNDIPVKKSITINYELRQRVSRTVLVPLKNQLKVIKTHTRIKTYSHEGLFKATMYFKNKFPQAILGVIIEDIIPTFYHYQIKLPKNILPEAQNEQQVGALIKWAFKEIPQENEILHEYQMIEMTQFENLKILVDNLSREAQNTLDQGDIEKTVELYSQILERLNKFI
ncbi:MAG: hypothetical protein K9W44_02180 [Candidatus Lokiarchaeota archaeon]|nr:hypothetical protein [Candidatus Harpocratesius repetitus]